MKNRHKKENKSTKKHRRIFWIFVFFLVVGIGVTSYILLFSAYTRQVEREAMATGTVQEEIYSFKSEKFLLILLVFIFLSNRFFVRFLSVTDVFYFLFPKNSGCLLPAFSIILLSPSFHTRLSDHQLRFNQAKYSGFFGWYPMKQFQQKLCCHLAKFFLRMRHRRQFHRTGSCDHRIIVACHGQILRYFFPDPFQHPDHFHRNLVVVAD